MASTALPSAKIAAALPVPLVDGRLAVGPRGRLLPGPGLTGLDLEGLDLHVVHPDAVHPLLEALGARPPDGPGGADGLLTGLQLPQQGQPSRVCQHPEDLSGKVQLICRRRRPTVIFVHAHMQSHECRGRK